jgi:hypothetical protein
MSGNTDFWHNDLFTGIGHPFLGNNLFGAERMVGDSSDSSGRSSDCIPNCAAALRPALSPPVAFELPGAAAGPPTQTEAQSARPLVRKQVRRTRAGFEIDESGKLVSWRLTIDQRCLI